MVQKTIYIPEHILKRIEEETVKLGYNISVSGWITQSCVDKLDNKCNGVNFIVDKLKNWHSSFPKKPFKDILKEIEAYNED